MGGIGSLSWLHRPDYCRVDLENAVTSGDARLQLAWPVERSRAEECMTEVFKLSGAGQGQLWTADFSTLQ
jgi:hypothetical protein